MNSSIHIVMGDAPSNENKWQKAFQNYLVYALREQYNISVSWQTPDSILEGGFSTNHTTFVLGVYTSKNLQDQNWVDKVTKLNDWTSAHSHAFFYKILREVVNATPLPSDTEQVKKFAFYVHDEKSGELIPEDSLLSDKINKFLPNTFELAREIDFQVKQAIQAQAITPSENGHQKSADQTKTVFLAQVSPQAGPLREKLKQELISQRFHVIPSTDYPETDLDELRQKIYQDIKQADLIIHLLGEEIDTQRDGVNSTIEVIQNEVAVKYFLEKQEDDENIAKRIVWIADNERLTNEQYKRFIINFRIEKKLHFGCDIYQCTIEELKEIVLDKLIKRPVNKVVNLSKEFIPHQVYLIHDVGTESDLYDIKGILENKGLSVVYLEKPKNQKEAQTQHEAFLFQSEGIIMLHNELNIRWVRAKINDIFKIKSKGRRKDYRFKAVLSRTLEQLPNEPIYRDVRLFHPEGELEFLAEYQILEKAE